VQLVSVGGVLAQLLVFCTAGFSQWHAVQDRGVDRNDPNQGLECSEDMAGIIMKQAYQRGRLL
jgi:hypothetical protein